MISVIIPAYNRAKTIKRAMDSVLNQTYSDLELIVVDDASTDDTESVVRSYADKRVCYIKQRKNQGACVARNTGIEVAKGEYIAFQDSDDSWRPEKLEKQLEALMEGGADICFCRMERHGYPDSKAKLYPVDLERGFVEYSRLLLKSYASTQTLFARAELFKKIRFDPDCKRMQDFDWMIRAGKDNKVFYLDDVLVDVYLQGNSITSFDRKKKPDNLLYFYNKYEYLFKDYPEFYRKLLNTIAYHKTVLGEDATEDYLNVYRSQKSRKALFHLIMSRMGLLKLYFSLKRETITERE